MEIAERFIEKDHLRAAIDIGKKLAGISFSVDLHGEACPMLLLIKDGAQGMAAFREGISVFSTDPFQAVQEKAPFEDGSDAVPHQKKAPREDCEHGDQRDGHDEKSDPRGLRIQKKGEQERCEKGDLQPCKAKCGGFFGTHHTKITADACAQDAIQKEKEREHGDKTA